MKFFDISLPIYTGMVCWPGHPPVLVERFREIETGASSNASRLEMSVHSGTHVDAQRHFLLDGATIEQLLPDLLIGSAQLVEFSENIQIISDELLQYAGILPDVKRLLLKTRNSSQWALQGRSFNPDFVALTPEAALWIVERGIHTLGIDALSIAKFHEPGHRTHLILLKAGVAVIEGLDFHAVPPGKYQLVCLPLKLVGSDGAPARAYLVEEQ